MKLLGKIFLGFILLAILGAGAAFYLTAGLVDEADKFFAAVRSGDNASAYEMLSTEFKKTASPQELQSFLEQSGLNAPKDISWANRQVSGGQGTLTGTVNTAEGAAFPLEVSFVKENGDWKILGLHKNQAGVQKTQSAQTAPLALPPESTQITLVQDALRVFGESIKEKSMERFHQHISLVWQKQFDVQKLEDAYKGAYGLTDDLTKISTLSPIFSNPAEIDQQGVMKIAGFFPTQPKRVNFEQKYIKEGTQWKLLGFNISFSSATT